MVPTRETVSLPLRVRVRNRLAAAFRNVPGFKGKGRIGLMLTEALTNFQNETECMATIRMRDGSVMTLDLRSFERLVLFLGNYDVHEMATLSRLISPESVVLDVGANVGFYTVGLARRSRARRIVAFEPVPANFERLRYHVERNALTDRVMPVNLALGEQVASIEMHLTDRGRSSTGNAVLVTARNAADRPASCAAAMTRLDDYAAQNGIASCDLIKVDIEGAELGFFKGAREFIRNTRPVVFSEYNPEAATEFGYTFGDLLSLFDSWRYETYAPRRRHGPYVRVHGAPEVLTNFLSIPVERREQVLALLRPR